MALLEFIGNTVGYNVITIADKDQIGTVKWNFIISSYCFYPDSYVVLSSAILLEIFQFITLRIVVSRGYYNVPSAQNHC